MLLQDAQKHRIAMLRVEATSLINEQWPVFAQSNAALGLYDSYPTTDPYNPATMKAGIQAIIDRVHIAIAAVNAAPTSEDALAVQL